MASEDKNTKKQKENIHKALKINNLYYIKIKYIPYIYLYTYI